MFLFLLLNVGNQTQLPNFCCCGFPGTLYSVLTLTLKPNRQWWPCRSQNEDPTFPETGATTVIPPSGLVCPRTCRFSLGVWMFFILNHGVSELTDVAGTAVRNNALTINWKGGLYLLWQLGLKVSLGRKVLKSEAGIDSPVVWNHRN